MSNFDAIVLGKKIKVAREKKKMSQKRLAEEAGISQNQLRRLEKGKSVPGTVVMARIIYALDEITDFYLEHIEPIGTKVKRLWEHHKNEFGSTSISDDDIATKRTFLIAHGFWKERNLRWLSVRLNSIPIDPQNVPLLMIHCGVQPEHVITILTYSIENKVGRLGTIKVHDSEDAVEVEINIEIEQVMAVTKIIKKLFRWDLEESKTEVGSITLATLDKILETKGTQDSKDRIN